MRDPRRFYRRVMTTLSLAGVPFLVGGAVAQARYTNIHRATKDLDLIVRKRDWPAAARALRRRRIATSLPFPHWLGKALSGGHQVDVIFGSGNGEIEVDDGWLDRAVDSRLLGRDVRLCAPEDLLWSKAFIMERERFDGADVLHLIHERGAEMDWHHLRACFKGSEQVLAAHLLLFRFVYPHAHRQVPRWILPDLLRAGRRRRVRDPQLCNGPLLSRAQYLVDISSWGYVDARLPPHGRMTPRERAIWTRAIGNGHENGKHPAKGRSGPTSTRC
jgi:hypothetical protein